MAIPPAHDDSPLSSYPAAESSRPYARWVWLAGPFREEDIVSQLNWLNDNGFGGVELVWLAPTWLGEQDPDQRPAWLSEELSGLLGFTKKYADEIGLGCDFTFGSGTVIGGSQVRPEDAAKRLDGPSPQRLTGSWEPGPQPIMDHLSTTALRRYAQSLAAAFAPGLIGSPSALVCDVADLNVERVWSDDLWGAFSERFGYGLEERVELSQTHPHMRYEYRRTVGSAMRRTFFETFARICRELGVVSRVRCQGAATDPLGNYARIDVPEVSVPRFEPPYVRIAASGATLGGNRLVSASCFGSLYGPPAADGSAPGRYAKREQLADLKLLADAVVANGANHIMWDAMPFNPPGGRNSLNTSTHLGPDSAFVWQLSELTAYLETVCGMMRRGRQYTNLALYFGREDAMLGDALPEDPRWPGPRFSWEMRQSVPPPETEGYHGLWVNEPNLQAAQVVDGRIVMGGVRFNALYLDAEWLDITALEHLMKLARAGAKVALKRRPKLPGMKRNAQYDPWLDELQSMPNARGSLAELSLEPLLEGEDLPWYWAREGSGELLIFFAHPQAQRVRYPLDYGAAYCDGVEERQVTIQYAGSTAQTTLRFEPYQSLLVRVSRDGQVQPLDVTYVPDAPMREASA